ncbi:MAG: sensor histidine kinase [Sphaerochaeta sp.]|uniref:sensor histidine kinase n=1 Tax=Sphaerochaeta sp. TaxID=1972642 RepID=UPI003D130986
MRRQFVRLFLGFVLVVAVVVGIQATVFLVTIHHQRINWTESVFQDYLSALSKNLSAGLDGRSYSLMSLEEVLLRSADDRVSGLYIRNPDGTVAIAYGMTSGGASLPVPRSEEYEVNRPMMSSPAMQRAHQQISEQGFSASEMHSSVYEVHIEKDADNSSLSVNQQSASQSHTILLPPQVKATDIAGSLVISYNDEVIALVDVLTFTPFTYKNTGYLFRGLLFPILWAMPIAFVIALMMAASISKRSERYTQGIQKALKQLSSGENGVELPKTKIDEQRVINDSIKMLDENLAQHKRSRQAWLRSISHDLNTPVASMKLLLDGIADGVFPANEKTFLALKNENDALSARIAQVVLYSNLQSPDMKVTREDIAIPSFIQQVFSSFTKEEQDRIYLDAEDASLQGDQNLLSYASRAMLSNALQASEGSVGWSIGKNTMTFTNKGTIAEGIDFFEPWSKGDASRGTSGSGLGLPITAQIMRLHHGEAEISQREGDVVVSLRW